MWPGMRGGMRGGGERDGGRVGEGEWTLEDIHLALRGWIPPFLLFSVALAYLLALDILL